MFWTLKNFKVLITGKSIIIETIANSFQYIRKTIIIFCNLKSEYNCTEFIAQISVDISSPSFVPLSKLMIASSSYRTSIYCPPMSICVI